MKKYIIILLLVFISLSALMAQDMGSTNFDMTGFPQWTRDLRRAEIIAFGSFPFAYFFSSFVYDAYRCVIHDWDMRYAPWPFEAAGSIGKSQDERKKVLLIAAGTAVFISLIDYSIVQIRRNRREKESRSLPQGTPIIIRKPLYGEEEGNSEYEETGNP